MDVWGSRRFRVRGAMALAGVTAVVMALTGCGFHTETSEPEALVDRFTELLDEQEYRKAADLTSYPNAASATMSQMFEGLQPGTVDYQKTQFIGLDDESAIFSMDVDWNFGEYDSGEKKEWGYSLQGTVRKLAIGWRISWEPQLVMPELAGGRTVRLVRTLPSPAPRVIDIVGSSLMHEQVINLVKLDPAKMPDPVASTDALAKAIEPVAPLITGAYLRDKLAASKGEPILAVRLREGDFAILEPRMAPIPGVVLEKSPELISSDRRVWSPMLDAMRNVWTESQDRHAGWGVQIFEPDGRFVRQVAGHQGPPGPDITSTMDQRLQRAAEDAVVSVGTPASIVAIQPSNGAVVAVAQNSYATEQGPVAFTGLYPVGGNVELLREVAALEKNKPPRDVTVQDAAEAAGRLGLGVDFQVPGLDEVTGRITVGGRGAEQARQGGGSDVVLASPFGMAIAAAAIARGEVPAPSVETGRPGTTDAQLSPLGNPVVDRLRTVLREEMGKPHLTPLRSFPVIAYAAEADSDGWLIANMGDLAFAIHIADIDSSNATARMAARMLQSLAQPET